MDDSKYWIVVKVKSNQEKIAKTNLKRQNFDFFHPQFKTIVRKSNKFKEIIKPVFPGYIFVSIKSNENNWQVLNNTKGLSRIIKFGDQVPFISTDLIKNIKSRFALEDNLSQFEKLEPGMSVEITNGPFTQLTGKIDKIDNDQRIWILLEFLGSQTRVSVNQLNLMKYRDNT